MALIGSDEVAEQPTAACPGHGGGSPESSKYHAPNLGFEQGFLLQHRGNAANPFCSPWDYNGRWWWLAGDRATASSSLGDGVQGLLFTSGDGEGTHGSGGLRQGSWGSRRGFRKRGSGLVTARGGTLGLSFKR
jgi:hypothetical protein